MTNRDRITFDLDADGYETERVDELVFGQAWIHLEMSSHSSGYINLDASGRQVFLRLYAQPTTRAERRRILSQEQDRLSDHLRSLLPWGGSMWSIPVYRRPVSAGRSWWEARRYAGVALLVQVEDDTGETLEGGDPK